MKESDRVMVFDIATPDSAYKFIQDFFDISVSEFIDEYKIRCNNDFEKFFDRHLDYIDSFSIEDLEYKVLHVTTNWDECLEIKKNGIKNLQSVLSDKSNLSSLLLEKGISFDIENRIINAGDTVIDIDYDKYKGQNRITKYEKMIKEVARKIYNDYQINGFFSNNNILDYGTEIHKRPEILINLTELVPQIKEIEATWRAKCKGYIITFFADFEQFAWYSFYNHEYEYWGDKENKQELKKWLISKAISRCFDEVDSHSEVYAYMDSRAVIKPEQIIQYKKIYGE